MPPKIKKVGKYELGVTLGQGAFGKVKICSTNENGVTKSYAIKLMDKNKIRQAGLGAQIKKEIRVMQALNHSSCIKLIEVLASKTTIFLVLELVTGGELFDRIVADGRFDDNSARQYFVQLVEGLEHCHSLGICHRDQKPENLLLDARGNLKITDFGLASQNENLDEHQVQHTACGTPNYVAPEVLMEKGYDGVMADIWSAGVILYVLLSGFLPFDEAQMVDLFRKIVCADFQYPSWMSQEAQQLISRLLEPDPERRANIEEIKNSAFYRGISHDDLRGMMEPEDTDTPTLQRKMSQFFHHDDLIEARVENIKTISSVVLASPVQKYDLENHMVMINNEYYPIVDWFTTRFPGRRSVTQTNRKKRVNKNRRASNPLLLSAVSPIGSPLPSSNNSNVVLPGQHADDEPVEEDEQPKPQALNAFDLINMVSGQSMNNMLLFNKQSSHNQPSFTQFTSRLATDELLLRIDYVQLHMKRVRYRVNYQKCQVSLVWKSPKNHRIAAHVEVYSLTPMLHMVQCKRMHGSILAHHEFFKKFREEVTLNEETVTVDTIHEELQHWQDDYPIFAEAYTAYKLSAQVLIEQPSDSLSLQSSGAMLSSTSPTPAHSNHHLSTSMRHTGHAGGGIETMISLTKARPKINNDIDDSSSSSDDEDDDTEDEQVPSNGTKTATAVRPPVVNDA